jgi:ribosomal protein L7/L12
MASKPPRHPLPERLAEYVDPLGTTAPHADVWRHVLGCSVCRFVINETIIFLVSDVASRMRVHCSIESAQPLRRRPVATVSVVAVGGPRAERARPGTRAHLLSRGVDDDSAACHWGTKNKHETIKEVRRLTGVGLTEAHSLCWQNPKTEANGRKPMKELTNAK